MSVSPDTPDAEELADFLRFLGEWRASDPGSGSHGRIHVAQAEPAGRLVLLRVIGDEHAGIEPLPEHIGVRLWEDVEDFLACVGQSAEDLGLVSVTDQRHRDDEHFRMVPAE